MDCNVYYETWQLECPVGRIIGNTSVIWVNQEL